MISIIQKREWNKWGQALYDVQAEDGRIVGISLTYTRAIDFAKSMAGPETRCEEIDVYGFQVWEHSYTELMRI